MNDYKKIASGFYDEQLRELDDDFHRKFELVWQPWEAADYPWQGEWVARPRSTEETP